MAVRHRKIVGETIKGSCADWNDLHNMATFELIEEKTTCTFSDLDEEYYIEGEITLTPNGASAFVYIKPNGASSGYSGNRYGSYSGVTAVETSDVTSGLLLTLNPVIEVCESFFTSRLICSPNKHKKIMGRDTISGNTHSGGSIYNVSLKNTDNFNSLIVDCVNGSYSGKIRLYKKIPQDEAALRYLGYQLLQTHEGTDEEYLIVFDGILNGTINAAYGSITTSAANYTTRVLSTNDFPIANSSFSDISPTVHSECRIFAKSGKKRLSSTHISAHRDRITISDDTGVWINPTTNITSLVVGTDATNFSGKFRLYQREVLND